VHDQALSWWALYNFGDAGLAPWPRWNTTPSEDLKEAASVIQMLGQGIAQLQQAGIRVDVEKIGARFGVSMSPTPLMSEGAGGRTSSAANPA
jgi:hypothetical protein